LHAELQALTDRLLFLQVLAHTKNNLTQAARILGITRATLRSKLGLLGITIERAMTVDEDEAG
jgi:DNA-binding protein Fis